MVSLWMALLTQLQLLLLLLLLALRCNRLQTTVTIDAGCQLRFE